MSEAVGVKEPLYVKTIGKIIEEVITAPRVRPNIHTYLITDAYGHGKIGKSCQPRLRFRDLQSGSPVKLTLYAVIPQDRETELHLLYRHLRLHGEWFQVTEELLAHFESYRIIPETHLLCVPAQHGVFSELGVENTLNVICPRCPESTALIVEVFFDERVDVVGPMTRQRITELHLVAEGEPCGHIFEIIVDLTGTALITWHLLQKPLVRRVVT